MKSCMVLVLSLASALLFYTSPCQGEDVARVSPHGPCQQYAQLGAGVPKVNETVPVVQETIENWKGIVLILAVGGVAFLFALIHRLIR